MREIVQVHADSGWGQGRAFGVQPQARAELEMLAPGLSLRTVETKLKSALFAQHLLGTEHEWYAWFKCRLV